jgi:glycosyltransferase involved in cell wall biosynthesis
LEVHVALPPGGPLVSKYEAEGVIVHPTQLDFPVREPWRFSEVFTEMRDLALRVKPDIIHSHFVGTTLTARLSLGRNHPVPRVFQVPGPLHLEHGFFRRVEIATAGWPDYWIGSCEWTRKTYLASGVPAERLFLSYYGVDLDKFTDHSKGKLRELIGVDSHTKLVGMVAYMYAPKRYLGQVRGLKGHEDLIDAMTLVLEEYPHARCVFVGGAWNGAFSYEDRVRAYARKKLGDCAVFLGTRDDVPYLYPDLDVAVHPSHSENVGGAVESLLIGVPTVATNVGGFPDLIKPGKTGWLVPPRDPSKLAEAISSALRDPVNSRRMTLRGQALAEQLFDVKTTARQVYDAYRMILS